MNEYGEEQERETPPTNADDVPETPSVGSASDEPTAESPMPDELADEAAAETAAMDEIDESVAELKMTASEPSDTNDDPIAPTIAAAAPTHPPVKNTRLWITIVLLASALAMLVGAVIGGAIVYRTGNRRTEDAIRRARESVVVIEVDTLFGSGIGSGIVMTSDGYIATNHHVIENAVSIRVFFTDGTMAEAELIGSSEMDDLAVIKVDRRGLTKAKFSDDTCYVGQTVYAIGHPGSTQLSWTTTAGIVSYVDREMYFYDDNGQLEKKMLLLQVDADVNPGNSGGPLVNEQGEVVGIISMRVQKMESSSSIGSSGSDEIYTGLGFALPIEGADQILQAIIRDGNADGVTSTISFRRPAIGIQCLYVEKDTKYTFYEDGRIAVGQGEAMPISGIYVSAIPEGSAAEGKLRVGDILTEMGGYELTSDKRLVSVINSYFPGDRVTVTVYRDGMKQEVTLTLGAAD